MSYAFEVDSYLDPDSGTDLVEMYEAYDEPFEDEDFEALGINPSQPTPARPGSEDKVLMLAARYAAGLPLWHHEDCYDHGPGETDLMGTREER